MSLQVILVQLETLKLENRHLSEMLEKVELGVLEVHMGWEGPSTVVPQPGSSRSLGPDLSLCTLVHFCFVPIYLRNPILNLWCPSELQAVTTQVLVISGMRVCPLLLGCLSLKG